MVSDTLYIYIFSLLIPTWWEDSFWLWWNVTLLSSKVDADAVALACAAQACRDGRRRVGCRISFEFGGWLWRNDEGVLFGWPVRALAPGIWWKGPLRYNKVPSGTQKWYHTIYHSCYNLICMACTGITVSLFVQSKAIQSWSTPPRRNNDAAKEIVSEMWADSAVEVVAPWKIPSNHRLILDDIGHSNMPYMQMIEYRITYIRIIVNYNELQYIFFLHRYTASRIIWPSSNPRWYLFTILNHLHEISRVAVLRSEIDFQPSSSFHPNAMAASSWRCAQATQGHEHECGRGFWGGRIWGGQKSVLIAAFVVEDNHTLDK